MKRILVGGLLGGLAVYAWGFISWMVLPWHEATLHEMPAGAHVVATLGAENLASGIYMYPGMEEASETGAMTEAETPAEPAMEAPAEAEGEATAEAEMEETAAVATEEAPAEAETEESTEPEMVGMVVSKEPPVVAADTETESTAAASAPFVFMMYSADGMSSDAQTRAYTGGLVLSLITGLFAAFMLSMVVGSLRQFSQRVKFVAMIGLFAALVSPIAAWNWMQFPTDYTLVMAADLVVGWVLGGMVLAWQIQPDEAAAA